MITQLIDALSAAFRQVVNLVGDVAGEEGVFGAISDLSSNVF